MTLKTFINEYCTACGGNWSNMLMSGIKKAFPKVYEEMPDKEYEFVELLQILKDQGITI